MPFEKKNFSPSFRIEKQGENIKVLKTKLKEIGDTIGSWRLNDKKVLLCNEIRKKYGKTNVDKYVLWHVLNKSDFEEKDALYYDFDDDYSIEKAINDWHEEYCLSDKDGDEDGELELVEQ